MITFHRQPRWLKTIAWFLVGVTLQLLLPVLTPILGFAQTPSSTSSSCAAIVAPLTPEEKTYARTAWQYFLKNYQPKTGLANAADQYPSGSLWDMGNYLTALNAARWLNLITQADFDARLNQFLTTLSGLKLFENTLPNKVYNTATGELVNYNNQPVERGLGWSALDIGRLLAAFHTIRTCHPQYTDWLTGIVGQWQIAKAVKDGQLYGATVTSDGSTMLVQEGRLGYEEYAARGFELWGFKAPKAIALEPFKFVTINGVQIPVDARDYQSTKANNYVVSESYILDGIEFGLQGDLAKFAANVLEVQKRRYESTGQLTSVSEDNLDQDPRFLYNTVYANGVAWAAITDENKPYPALRSISTKSAFGWRYLFPENAYAKQVFDAVKALRSPNGAGFYAGLYEASGKPNEVLTGNTNGLILEILYYKARGNQPLIGSTGVTFATAQSPSSSTEIPPSPAQAPAGAIIVSPIESVGPPQPSSCPAMAHPLSAEEQRYANAAWQYFEKNRQAQTGLVSDRSDLNAVSLWGIGDYLAALHAARSLDIISASEFDQRTRHLLGAVAKLPLFAGALPSRGYNTQTLQPVDYGNNTLTDGNGWSSLDLGRLLAALYNLKTCHPEYTKAVDETVLHWSYLRVVQNGSLVSAATTKDGNGRSIERTYAENQLGYAEYAARAFQLWGFEVEKSAVSERYETVAVEGANVPVQRVRPDQPATAQPYITTDPFLLYGLEFGFDPQMRSLVQPIFEAQATRYRRTGIFTASGTSQIDRPPYVVRSTVIGQGEPWAALTGDGKTISNGRIVSTAVAFAYRALFPSNDYANQLWQKTAGLYDAKRGYQEGFYEKTGKLATGFSSSTNSLILQSLLYSATNRQPLLIANPVKDSPWWQAITKGTLDRGLPKNTGQTARITRDASGSYWISGSASTPEVATVSSTSSATVPTPTPASGALSSSSTQDLHRSLSEADQTAAKLAWRYFERNWDARTGLVNAVDQLPWTTLWDQGSALIGIHAAKQLGLLAPEQFKQRMTTLLNTLERLPLAKTGLPNKAYSTSTAQMRQLDNTPDPNGISGWSVLDTARLLMGLHILKAHYPEYGDRIDRIVARWNLTKLVKDGWLSGGIPTASGRIQVVQEGRLGYEQYAAQGLKLWNLDAANALHRPPTKTVQVDGVTLHVDQRELKNSGASNYLTSDPYLLWGLELGWDESVKPHVQTLFKVQEQRFQRTGIITAVNEDSLDRPPYFLYYSIYANGQPWHAINVKGKAFPELRFLSTKAAFAWSVLMPETAYAKTLQTAVQVLADPKRGYFSGQYENSQLGKNRSIDINTNAIVLESLLYKARGNQPLAF